MEADDSREDLSALHADALTTDLMDPAVLLRYAQAPEDLAEDQRARVEAYLARSPAHRDELRLLARMAELRTSSPDGSGSGAAGEGEASPESIASHPRWRTRAAIGLALAASLLLALIYAVPDPPGSRADLRLAGEEPALGPSAQTTEIPQPAPTLGDSPGAIEIAQDQSISHERSPEPAAQTPVQVAAADPLPGASEEMVSPLDGRDLAPDPREEGPAPPVTLLAMNIKGPLEYLPPTDHTYLEPLGALRNASADLPSLQALVPDHVAQTAQASPTLYWFLSDDTNRPVDVVVADRISIDPALELQLEPPIRAGIHAISLAEHGIELEPGLEYRWFVSLGAQHLTRGAIRRVAPDSALEAKLSVAGPGALGQLYAAAGLWYDSLDFISRGIERSPEDVRVRELRASLLQQVGLGQAAAHERARPMGSFGTSPLQ